MRGVGAVDLLCIDRRDNLRERVVPFVRLRDSQGVPPRSLDSECGPIGPWTAVTCGAGEPLEMHRGDTRVLRPGSSPSPFPRNRFVAAPQVTSAARERCDARLPSLIRFTFVAADHPVVDPVPVAIDAEHPRGDVDILFSFPPLRVRRIDHVG